MYPIASFLIHIGIYAFIWALPFIAGEALGIETNNQPGLASFAVILALICFYPSAAVAHLLSRRLQSSSWLRAVAIPVLCGVSLVASMILLFPNSNAGGYFTLPFMLASIPSGALLFACYSGMGAIAKDQSVPTRTIGFICLALPAALIIGYVLGMAGLFPILTSLEPIGLAIALAILWATLTFVMALFTPLAAT